DDIVLSANLAKGTFYYHFESKEELLVALQEAVLSKAIESVRQKLANGASPLKLLVDFVAETGHWTEENPEFARAVFRQKSAQFTRGVLGAGVKQGKDCTKEFPQDSFPGLVMDLLKQAQKVGEIRGDVETNELAGLVMPVIMHAKARWLFRSEGSLPALLERRLKLLIEGLKAGRRPNAAD
ncbi:MAG: hypothetical protein C5B53_13505, partial [Candidatus Melainabacteria bacterium]